MIPHSPQIGVLLVNLGTPDSYHPLDVFRYLNEFLTDQRVIDFPWLKRQFLVRGLIVPFRYRQSAQQYKELWTEEGSPLLIHSRAVQKKLQASLGSQFHVSLAMRYQNPSIASALEELQQLQLKEIIILPLFPQYASATTGSVHQKVMHVIQHWPVIPALSFINSYPDHPAFIRALVEKGQEYPIESYDHILFSFHGLPERQIRKIDAQHHCFSQTCCHTLTQHNQFCYKAQCYATSRALAHQLNLSPSRYTICFQSRLGKDPWIQPYTSNVVAQCAKQGYKRLLVFCPAFVCDCLETIYEINQEYGKDFRHLGGEHLQLVEGLNSHPAWISALTSLILERCVSNKNK